MLGYTAYLSALYCFLILLVYFRARKIDETKNALDLGLLIMIFGFLGARLFHVFYENPEHYREDWLRVFQIWYGGFVFYGGAFTAFVACWIFIRRRQLDWRFWCDFYSPIIALGYGLGRISCFIAGCCYGRACELPWSVDGRHPTQLYATAWELAVVTVLLALGLGPKRSSEKTRLPRLAPGKIFFLWLILHSLGRLMMEYFRGDFRGSLWLGQSISTWISLLLLSIGLVLFFKSTKQNSQKNIESDCDHSLICRHHVDG